jgi:hypothetical protein
MEESLVSSYVLYEKLRKEGLKPTRVRSTIGGFLKYWIETEEKQKDDGSLQNYVYLNSNDEKIIRGKFYYENGVVEKQIANSCGIFKDGYRMFPPDDMSRLLPYMLKCPEEKVVLSFQYYQRVDLKNRHVIRVRGLHHGNQLNYWCELRDKSNECWIVFDYPIIKKRDDYYRDMEMSYVQIAECGIFKDPFEGYPPDDLNVLRPYVNPLCKFYTMKEYHYQVYTAQGVHTQTDYRKKQISFF